MMRPNFWFWVFGVIALLELFVTGMSIGEGKFREAGYWALGLLAFAILAVRELWRVK